WQCKDIATTADGKILAISEQEKGVHLFDALGKRIGRIGVTDLYKGLVFTPEGKYLVINGYRADEILIWNVKDSKQVCKIPLKGGVYALDVSPNGEYLGAATGRGAFVWRLLPLLAAK